MKNKWFRKLFRRRILIALLIILQAAFLLYAVISGSKISRNIGRLLTLISVFVVLYIVSKRDKGAYKTLWVFLILAFPIFGGLLYLLVYFQSTTSKMRKQISKTQEKALPLYTMPGDGMSEAEDQMDHHIQQVRYLQNYAKFPVYSNTKTSYF